MMKKLKILAEATSIINEWKSKSNDIVFTNGCFDILHAGHVDYLEKAKKLGDKLIVGLNSDDSIRRLKGESRPINNVEARAKVLNGLKCVDLIIVFDDDTPLELIKNIIPDVLVKGNDYNVSEIVGSDFMMKNGGCVTTLPLLEGYSTTNIINKIKGENNKNIVDRDMDFLE